MYNNYITYIVYRYVTISQAVKGLGTLQKTLCAKLTYNKIR